MPDNTSTEPTTETVDTEQVEAATQEVVDRDDVYEMSDEEFDKHVDTLVSGSDDSEDTATDEPKDKVDQDESDLEKLYKQQLENGFKLEEPILVKVNGKVLDIDDPKDAKALIEKGLDYTRKTQELAQYRNTLAFLEENGISDVDTLKQVLSGQIQVDPTQLQEPSKVDPVEQQANQVAEQILQSEYADDMKSIIGSLPADTKQQLSSNPQMLQGLFIDVQNGFAQQVLPLAQKYMTINGLNFVDAYIKAGDSIAAKSTEDGQKRKVITSEPRSKGKAQKRSFTREDVFNMDEAEFEKYLSKL